MEREALSPFVLVFNQPTVFFKIHFNSVFSSACCSYKRFVCLSFSHHNCMHFSSFPCVLRVPSTLHTSGEEYRSWSSALRSFLEHPVFSYLFASSCYSDLGTHFGVAVHRTWATGNASVLLMESSKFMRCSAVGNSSYSLACAATSLTHQPRV